MVFNLAVTSSSYDAAFAMATGAAGAELAFASDWGAAFTNGAAATMASHSLRVIVFPSWVLCRRVYAHQQRRPSFSICYH
jgi:hypothetical protein